MLHCTSPESGGFDFASVSSSVATASPSGGGTGWLMLVASSRVRHVSLLSASRSRPGSSMPSVMPEQMSCSCVWLSVDTSGIVWHAASRSTSDVDGVATSPGSGSTDSSMSSVLVGGSDGSAIAGATRVGLTSGETAVVVSSTLLVMAFMPQHQRPSTLSATAVSMPGGHTDTTIRTGKTY